MNARKGSHVRHPAAPCQTGTTFPPSELTPSTKTSMTIVAIPDWKGRVSPVFDVAGRLLVAQVTAGFPPVCTHQQFFRETPAFRVSQLAKWRIGTLICGGISSRLRDSLEHEGVTVIPHICGSVQDVLQAYLENRLSDERFAMPGCCSGCRWCQTRHRPRPNRRT